MTRKSLWMLGILMFVGSISGPHLRIGTAGPAGANRIAYLVFK